MVAGSKPAALTNTGVAQLVVHSALNREAVGSYPTSRANTLRCQNGHGPACKAEEACSTHARNSNTLRWLEWTRPPPSKRTLRGFESCPERQNGHVAQMEEPPGPNGERAGSIPAVVTKFRKLRNLFENQWRTNPPGRGRRLLSVWHAQACENRALSSPPICGCSSTAELVASNHQIGVRFAVPAPLF